jgi:LPXTG-motif cell wall-anchored protein
VCLETIKPTAEAADEKEASTMKKLSIMVLAAFSMLFVVSPAFAQENLAETEGVVEGVFRVVLEGDVPENYSVYAETDAAIGGMDPICTTDITMVDAGYTECAGDGSINELLFSVPQGATINYRILASQGAGLAQTVIAEGSTLAETDGFIINASHTFTGEPNTDEELVIDEDTGTGEEQYASEAPASDSGDVATSEVAEANGGVLPDTGGTSFSLLVGAVLLFVAGGFLAYRRLS